jgi:predicted nucleotide-binding protein
MMKQQLEAFLARIPNLHRMSQRELVAFFGFFLTEIIKDPDVRPKRLRECFDTALISAPGNISDVVGKSGSFVSTKSGLQLRREIREQIIAATGVFPPGSDGVFPAPVTVAVAAMVPNGGNSDRNSSPDPAPVAAPVPGITKNVMVVYGRDQDLRDSMFSFLRALKLNPIEWSEGAKATGKGSPYVGEILDAIFRMAQAVVVLLTPDEEVRLRRDLCADDDEFKRETGFQPRANVQIEAGMALAKSENRTILVQVGDFRLPSDLHGRHIVRLDDSAEKRNELAQRLKTAGCDPDTGNPDWYRFGTFKVTTKKKRGSR